jgi:nicotinate-nucleotide pyrophosphorylase
MLERGACGVPPTSRVLAGTTLAILRGPSNEMLQLERPVLNIVGRLSGISTGTRRYHEGIIHTHTRTHAHKGGISTSTRRYHEAS